MNSQGLHREERKLEVQVATALCKIAQGIEKMTRKEGEKEGLSSTQVQTLLFLSDAHPKSRYIGSIAERFKISSPTVTRIVDSLEKKELVERVRSQKDRRSVKVELTKRGEAVVNNMADLTGYLGSLVSGFSVGDKNILRQGLTKIMKSMQREGYISFSTVCRNCVYFKPDQKPGSEKPHRCGLTDEYLSEDESYTQWVHPRAKVQG